MKKQISIILKKIIADFQKKEIWPVFDVEEIAVSYPKEEKFGDYTTNIAMVLAQKIGKSPTEIAREIISQFPKTNYFQKIETIAPGYINFYLASEYFQKMLTEILKKGNNFGNSEIGKGKRIHLDFVSANPTGPVHIGNSRGGPYGSALANVLEKGGYKVWKEYYVNDYGNQIKTLGHSVLKDDKAQYKGDYIDFLRKRIKSKDPFEAGQKAAKIIVQEIIKPSMKKMGIKFDNYFSEKKLHDSGEIKRVFDYLAQKNLLYEKNGAWWFRSSQFGDEKDRVVKKSSGEITYFGGDIAYHKNKFERGFDKIINIWGADHHGDVKRVLGAIEALGYGGRAKIILTQFVKVMSKGKEIKMSKRQGTYITTDDLIEEVKKDAIWFFFLLYSPDTHMYFDLELAKERSEKNPVYYVQYAHARICSILAKVQKIEIKNNYDLALLVHPKELSLMRELNKFPEIIEEIIQSYEVHKLSHYAIKLADKFHSFYDACRVIDEKDLKLAQARIVLIRAVKTVLVENLRLIGISAPKKM